MCLTLYFKTEKEARAHKPIIASRDIVVYKHLDKNNRSPYTGYQYNKGMHYYQTGRKFGKAIKELWDDGYNLEIHVGLHCYKYNKNIISYIVGDKIVKMIIPKGSEYYQSGNHIVTDNLIWY